MLTSTDRILTTHTGSLPRPPELADAMVGRETGTTSPDSLELAELVETAVDDVVRRQVERGLDIVSDGEMSKIGYSTYVKERLTGFDGEAGALSLADLEDFPEFTERALSGLVTTTPACTGAVQYVGHDALQADLATLSAAITRNSPAAAFVPAASPGVIALFLEDQHYGSREDYLGALAEAMRTEYEAIVDAGFTLQVDCPDLAMGRHAQYADLEVADFVKAIDLHVEALNSALRNIDPDRVRIHLCWGNYEGPHHHDVALADILPTVLRVNAQGLVVEAANPRHAHEWKVFEDIALPEDKILVPGVIDTSSNYIEHPELVAERLVRYAGVVGRERVIAGADCGFATFATFLPIEPNIAWAKLDSLTHGATIATGRLW